MMLVTVNDVTQLRKLESFAQTNSVKLTMVGEILAIREDDFRRFMSDARDLLEHSHRLLRASNRSTDCLRLILIDVHTLKGSARTLHLSRLTEALHHLERNYRGQALDQEAATALLHDLDRAMLILREYEDVALNKLKWDADTSPTVKIKKEVLESGLTAMKQLFPGLSESDVKAWKPIFQLLQALNEAPLEQILKNLFQMAARIAADLGKPAPQLDIDVPSMTCNETMAQLLRKVLVHIVRNIMDHGIEYPEERVALGKGPAGLILVRGELVKDDIVLWIRDDGRGLDLEELARTHGQTSCMDAMSLANLIFEEGVSTAQTITDISGHGLGMPAVRRFIEDCGGKVQIILDDCKHGTRRPFQLCIRLPLSGFTQIPLDKGTAA
jgi:chemotaxis protein histidine kinase CheA